MLVDVFSKGITGKAAEAALGKAGITVNKNAIPFDQNPPMVASGIRVGTPAITSRGMREAEMDHGRRIHRARARVAGGRGGAGTRQGGSRGPVPEVPAVPRGVTDRSAAVGAIFAPGGPLSLALDGFEARPAQLEMAEAVADVFADGGVLLAEAGTGTGKTLAYLVPAILSRERVLISTGTKNLQEQIFFKDLPVLRETLGIPFTAAYMKGRGNYLCLHRFEALKDSAAIRSREDAIAIEAIDEWSRETETGDRAEMEDLPEDLPLWPDIAATSENCIGADCPRFNDCFVTKMRQRAAESDVVIVNHHLLCADASVRQSAFGEVIPSCRYAIVDEAHQLEDVATQYFGTAVSNYRFDDFARDVDRAISARQIPDRDAADTLRDDVDNVRDGARLFFGTLQMLRFEGRRRRPRAASASPRRRSSAPRPTPRALVRALEAIEATIALDQGPARGRHRARPPRRGAEARRAVPDPRRRSRVTSTTSTSAAAACSCAPRRSTCRTSSARCCSTG